MSSDMPTLIELYKYMRKINLATTLFGAVSVGVVDKYQPLQDMLTELYANYQSSGGVEDRLFYGAHANRRISRFWLDPANIDTDYSEHLDALGLLLRDFSTKWLEVNAYKVATKYDTTQHYYNPIYNYERYEERESEHAQSGSASDSYGAKSFTKGAQTDSSTASMTQGQRSDSWSTDQHTDIVTQGQRSDSWSTDQHTDTNSIGGTQETTQYGSSTDTDTHSVYPFTTTGGKTQSEDSHTKGQHTDTTTTTAHTDSTQYGAQGGSNTKGSEIDSTQYGAQGGSSTKGSETDNSTDSTTYGQRTDTEQAHSDTHSNSSTGTNTESSHIYGNIGVTTSGAMLMEQREVADFAFWEWLYNEFCNAVTEEVY